MATARTRPGQHPFWQTKKENAPKSFYLLFILGNDSKQSVLETHELVGQSKDGDIGTHDLKILLLPACPRALRYKTGGLSSKAF